MQRLLRPALILGTLIAAVVVSAIPLSTAGGPGAHAGCPQRVPAACVLPLGVVGGGRAVHNAG